MENYVFTNTSCPGICGQECYDFIFYGNFAFSGICLAISLTLASLIFAGPFYGTMSYLTIVTKDHHGFWIVMRSIYDSFLLYFFFTLIVSYIAYEDGKINRDIIFESLHQKEQIRHGFPFHYCIKPIPLNSLERAKFFYMVVKNNVMQFFILNASMTFISCIVAIAGGSTAWTIIRNTVLFISICFCLYYLLLFYNALEKELKPYRPLLKFLAVKGIIFFTFWQALTIEIFQDKLLQLFKICDIDSFEPKYIIDSASCMLVCFEMIILTIMTSIAFSYKEFESTIESPLKKQLLLNVVQQNLKDQFADLYDYDVLKTLPFTQRQQIEAVIVDKSLSTSYIDANGKVVDASSEASSKLYDERIDVIPNGLNSNPSSPSSTPGLL